MCEIQCLIFELYTNMVGGGQISHNSSIKRFFVQVSSCITTWKGCTLKFLTFIFLHWFMQCPSVHSSGDYTSAQINEVPGTS